MFNKTDLVTFSIWPKTCLSDTGSDECFLSFHPCGTCLPCSLRQVTLITVLETLITHLESWLFVYFRTIFYDLIHSCHRVCAAGKVHETFQTYIGVLPDLNLFFHAGLLMLFLVGFLLHLGWEQFNLHNALENTCCFIPVKWPICSLQRIRHILRTTTCLIIDRQTQIQH